MLYTFHPLHCHDPAVYLTPDGLTCDDPGHGGFAHRPRGRDVRETLHERPWEVRRSAESLAHPQGVPGWQGGACCRGRNRALDRGLSAGRACRHSCQRGSRLGPSRRGRTLDPDPRDPQVQGQDDNLTRGEGTGEQQTSQPGRPRPALR